jgi:hypothetical protein
MSEFPPVLNIKGLLLSAAAAMSIATFLTVPGALADEGAFALGVKGGTLGTGVEATIGTPLQNFNLRGQINGFTYGDDIAQDGINYTGDLELFTIGGLVDYHVAGTGLRFSGGAFSNGNKFSLTGEPVGATIQIGDTVYSTTDAGTVTADVEFSSLAPYFGIGYGNALKGGSPLKIGLDLGVLYQGDPDANVSATGPLVAAADLAVAAEKLDTETEDMKWYPVVSIGVSYRF